MNIKVTAILQIDNDDDLSNLKACTHHGEWLFDLEAWPEIKNVSSIKLEEEK